MTFEELNVVRTLRKQIADEERKLEVLKYSIDSITPKFKRVTQNGESFTCLDDSPKSKSHNSRTETISTLIIDTENKIAELHKQLDKETSALIGNICREYLDTIKQIILIHRYVNGKSFREIARAVHYSKSQVCIIHKKIISGLKK